MSAVWFDQRFQFAGIGGGAQKQILQNPIQKRQRQRYNAGQSSALRLEAQKAARGEARSSKRDISDHITSQIRLEE
jgi:hypothetical protein